MFRFSVVVSHIVLFDYAEACHHFSHNDALFCDALVFHIEVLLAGFVQFSNINACVEPVRALLVCIK